MDAFGSCLREGGLIITNQNLEMFQKVSTRILG